MSDKKDREELQYIGERIRSDVERCGIFKKDLAEMLHVSPQTISNYLSGRRGLTFDDALKIAKLTKANVNNYLTQEQRDSLAYSEYITSRDKNDLIVSMLKEIGYHVDIANCDNPARSYTDEPITFFYLITDERKKAIAEQARTKLNELAEIEKERPLTQRELAKKKRYELADHQYKYITLNKDQWESLSNSVKKATRKEVVKRLERFETSQKNVERLSNSIRSLCNELKDRGIDIPQSKELLRELYRFESQGNI